MITFKLRMKKAHFLSILVVLLLLNSCKTQVQDSKEENLRTTQNTYLGQTPPGKTPELFAPEIIRTEFRQAAGVFTPDLKEFYFRRRGGQYKYNTLVVVKKEDNQWKETVVAEKSGEPSFSVDGNIMHLGERYRELTSSGWSEPKNLEYPFDKYRIMRLTSAANGTYYFDEASEAGQIRYSRLINGKYEEPKDLIINDIGEWNAHPFIAPDESYIIWDDQRDNGGYGDADLYISFRQKDGSWSDSINLGNTINTEFAEAYGSISPDGKYLFFHRSYGGSRADIYWVKADEIFKLKNKQ